MLVNTIRVLVFVALGLLPCVLLGAAGAQTAAPPTRLITIEGGPMRVWTAGLEQRGAGQPVVVLEAGAGEGLDTWRPVFPEIAKMLPVVAYDRRGIGQSAVDTEAPTLRRVARSLHALLSSLGVPPPYLLVGHSWGGLIVRAFAEQHPTELSGLLFLDVTDFETTNEERAAAVSPEDREKVTAPPTMPTIPANTPAGLRAEFQVLSSEMTGGYPEARSLRPVAGVPTVVVVATPPGRLEGLGGAMVRLQIKHQAEWALSSPKGLFVAASHVGHFVHRDDPGLVIRLLEHLAQNGKVPAQ
jgi:pimeloyl-ACP methyl ester carboxylesterase